MQRPKLSVSFSGSRLPKMSVSITINNLVHFGLITVDTDSLESFIWSHYTFLMIDNFASENSGSVKPAKPFIPDNYKNHMELNKLKRIKYFTKALLKIRACASHFYWINKM